MQRAARFLLGMIAGWGTSTRFGLGPRRLCIGEHRRAVAVRGHLPGDLRPPHHAALRPACRLIFLPLRFGPIAIISTVFFIKSFEGLLLGSDWKAWYAPSGIVTLSLMLGIALFAFWRSLGSRELLSGDDAAS